MPQPRKFTTAEVQGALQTVPVDTNHYKNVYFFRKFLADSNLPKMSLNSHKFCFLRVYKKLLTDFGKFRVKYGGMSYICNYYLNDNIEHIGLLRSHPSQNPVQNNPIKSKITNKYVGIVHFLCSYQSILVHSNVMTPKQR